MTISNETLKARGLFASRLSFILKQEKMNQNELAKKLGVSESTVGKWVLGKSMPRTMGIIQQLADLFDVGKSFFLEYAPDNNIPPTSTPAVKIKVLGTVAAGVPMYAAENIIDEEEISAEMARDGEYFGLLIKGQSMEPKLYEGDVVIVRKQDYIENGETAIILINGDEATCKLVKEMPDGIMLIGHNTAVYEPHFYSRQEIEKLPVRVIGKVVELRRKF